MTDPPVEGEIAITRVYDAPRELVWRAWTEPERLAAWWGRRGWNAVLSSIEIDLRPGGVFRVTTVNEADGAQMTTSGVYREVVEPERLVFADPDRPGAVGSVVLTDLGGGRTEMRFRAGVRMGALLRERAAAGVASAFDRLAEHLTAPTSTRGER